MVEFTQHARDERRSDALEPLDIESVLEGGVVDEPEWEKEALRHRVRTARIEVIVEFEPAELLVIVTMKCRGCGGEASERRGDFGDSEATGLPVRLVGVTLIRCGACGAESVRIPRLTQLHGLIAGTLIRKDRVLAPAEFRFLRKWLRLSGAAFSRRMGVAAETISRWENGKMTIPAPADRTLRLMVVCERPRTDYSAEALDRAGSENAPSMPIELRASGRGWQGPKAAEPGQFMTALLRNRIHCRRRGPRVNPEPWPDVVPEGAA